MFRATALALLLFPGALFAHDFWLAPATYYPAPGAAVPVRLEVGDHYFSEGARPFQKEATPRLQLLGARTTLDLRATATEGARPFARLTIADAGTYWLAADRAARLIVLKPGKFDDYLREEGLEVALALRKKLGESDRPGRERYARSLKALLRVGKGDDNWKRVLGQRLEIGPLVDPCRLRVGGKLPVRVLFEGKALGGVRVTAYRRDGEKTVTRHATTSAAGEATFALDATGPWLVRLVHMRRVKGDAEADWHSDWSAFSFALPGR